MDVMQANNVQVQVDRFITQSLSEKDAMQQTVTTVNENSCHLKRLVLPMN